MRPQKKEYRRLPGTHKNFVGSRSTLWRGNDHLLFINYTYGTERYKRFYYKDIQAFIIRKSVLGKIQNISMGAFIAFFALIAYAIGAIEGVWTFGILSAATALILLVNVILGPTCECLIQTAVQKEKLKNLNRLRTAVKAINIITPLIRQAQGDLSIQELQAGWRAAPAKAKTSGPTPETVLPGEHRQGKIHAVLFSALLILGLVVAFGFYHQHMVVVILEMILGLGTAVLLIPALVRQHQGMAGGVRIITWISLGYMSVFFLCGYIIFIFLTFRNPAIVHDQWLLVKMLAGMSPTSHPLLFGTHVFAAVGAGMLGLGGLFLLRRP